MTRRHLLALLLSPALLNAATIATAEPEAAVIAAAARQAVDHVRPLVVQVQPIGGTGLDNQLESLGPTTGTMLTDDGWIITSSYQLKRGLAGLVVTFDDGCRSPAKLVSIDYANKLALIKAEQSPKNFASDSFAAEDPQVGQTAIGVGRVYRADEPNLSIGIVSALNRLFGRALQTDAAVSPANYGGPLVDVRGKVLGILTPLAPTLGGDTESNSLQWYDSGIGFAIPLAKVMQQLPAMQKGDDLYPGLAGLAFEKGNAHVAKPRLGFVHPEGPAAEAKLEKGDLIIAIDDKPTPTQTAYRFATASHQAGETIELSYVRGDDQPKSVTLKLVKELSEIEPKPDGKKAKLDAIERLKKMMEKRLEEKPEKK